MPQIILDLGHDLTFNTDGELTIAISPEANNIFKLNDDGIYALGLSNVWNIKDGEKTEGITVGIRSTYYPLTSNAAGRIATTGMVHRTFRSTGTRVGEKLTGRNTSDVFRSDLDHCLPGDIFCVKQPPVSEDADDVYDYYLILTTDPKKDDNGYAPGNVVSKYVKLGTFRDPNVTLESWVYSYDDLISNLTIVQLEHFFDPTYTVKTTRETVATRIEIAPHNPIMVEHEVLLLATVKTAYPKDTTRDEEYYLTLEEMRTQLMEHGLSSDTIDQLTLDQLQANL